MAEADPAAIIHSLVAVAGGVCLPEEVRCLGLWPRVSPGVHCGHEGHSMVQLWFTFQPDWCCGWGGASGPSTILIAYEIRCGGMGSRQRIHVMEV